MSDPNDPAGPTRAHEDYDAAPVDRARRLLDAMPELVGPYRLLERLGHGGMGEVYVAEQSRPLKRRVALKVIKRGMDTRQVVARFEAERQALAMMDHPNIARVFDAGTTDTGQPYFVMELVRGVPITQFCDDAKLSTRQRVELLVPVCQAVQHAHQKGIIHRDLKPTNVLVTLHDGRPVPKVIDFGIAKATGQSLTDKTIYTEFRAMIGTPAYMSPEQAEMSGLDIDTRSDVYSLGVLTYELLTGTTPFDTTRLMNAGLMEIGRIIREEDPPRPSLRLSTLGERLTTVATQRGSEAGRLGKLVAGELDWIVMRAMEKDRRRRYETANDLAADFNRHLAGEPIEAAPPSAAYRARKFARKHRAALTIAAAVALALSIGMAGTVSQWRRAERSASVARTNEAAAERSKDSAETEAYIANLALAQAAMQADRWPEARQRLEACPEAKRGWEWRYLRETSENVDHAFTDDGTISTISADGRLIATLGLGHAVRIHDLATGRPLNFPRMPITVSKNDSFGCFAFDQHGKHIAVSAGTDVTLFEISGRLLAGPCRQDADINRVGFAPDGASFVALLVDGTARRWSLDGRSLGPAQKDDLAIADPPPSPLALMSTEDYRAVALREAVTGRTLGVFRDDVTSGLCDPSLVPGGRQVVVASGQWYPDDWTRVAPSRRLVIDVAHFDTTWFKVDGSGERELEAQLLFPLSDASPTTTTAEARFAVRTTDGGRMITSAGDAFVRFLDAHTGRELAVVPTRSNVTRLRLSGDGTRLILDLADETLLVWDARGYAARQADRDARFAEIPEARDYVRKLVTVYSSADAFKNTIRNDASITTLRKLVALEQLDLELARRKAQHKTAHEANWDLLVNPGGDPHRYAEALSILKEAVDQNLVASDNFNALAYAEYRTGDLASAIATLERKEAVDPDEEGLPAGKRRHLADWAFLAMAEFRMGHPDRASVYLTKMKQSLAATDDSHRNRYAALSAEAIAMMETAATQPTTTAPGTQP